MHRFFVSPDQIAGAGVRLSPEQAHQISRVLRLKPGDSICVLDGSGREADAILTDEPGTATLQEWRRCEAEPRAQVCLALGLLKGEKMDWAIQKATEVGAAAIVPVACARSVVRLDEAGGRGKAQRWRRIAQEAAEQCRRGRVPRVSPPMPLAGVLTSAGEFDRVLLAYEGDGLQIADCRLQIAGPEPRVLLMVGPEGGFAPEEVQQARAAGAAVISLGARILRAETAAIVGVALLLHELEREIPEAPRS